MKKIVATLPLVLALAGCSGFGQGYFQSVTVTTEPANAICHFSHEGQAVFDTVVSGEPAYNIRRGPKDLLVTCKKDGYYDGFAALSPTTDTASYQSFVIPDVLLGTNKAYPDTVHIKLRRI